jgi:hypothetical protein
MVTPAQRHRPLPVLFAEVQRTRSALAHARATGHGSLPARTEQRALLAALIAYTDALVTRHLPVPYTLHTEVQVYRGAVSSYPR